MLRSLVIAVLLVGIGASSLVMYRWWAAESGDRPATIQGVAEACYPLAETCQWQTGAGLASVAMERLGGDEVGMTVRLPGTSEPVIAILTGESMYMGEYPLRLEQTEPGRYRTEFVPPFCSTGADMVWRVNLRTGSRDITPPFAMLFRAG